MRAALGLSLCAAAGLALATVPAAAPSTEAGPRGCRFALPDDWPADASPPRWSGACRAGRAEGLGVLRSYRDGRLSRAFYGRLARGEPQLGVIDLGNGFRAGRFVAGRVVPNAERDTLIEAFEAARMAAHQLARRYRAGGQAASARYYEGKARQLAAQID